MTPLRIELYNRSREHIKGCGAAESDLKMVTREVNKKEEKSNIDNAEDDDFTERVLLSIVFDVSMLHETVERLRVQVHAIARKHGIDPLLPKS